MINHNVKDYRKEIETEYQGESDITMLWTAITDLQERIRKLEKRLTPP